MPEVLIKKITLKEAELLQEVARSTFAATFAAYNTEASMKNYLAGRLSLEQLTKELLDPHSEFYFALVDQQITGYLKINTGPGQTELKEQNTLEIERIYVLEAFQGHRIGQRLLEKAESRARSKKVNFIWLGVWENNHKAIQFYQKNGFVHFAQHAFQLGDELQTDWLMKRELG